MDPIRVIIADDNEDSLEIIRFFLEKMNDITIIDVCKDGQALVHLYKEKKPDLVLVDINMPKLNGVEAIKQCLDINNQVKFIFITSYEEYAIEAFQMDAIDYVVKPIEKLRLYKALEKAKKIVQFEKRKQQALKINNLPIKDYYGTSYVAQHDIFFIEKSGKKCLIHTADKVYETQENISSLSARLDESFFSAHRSYIINVKKVSHIVPQNETYLAYFHQLDKQAYISKLKINELKEKITLYIRA